jgi:hypothetical protein
VCVAGGCFRLLEQPSALAKALRCVYLRQYAVYAMLKHSQQQRLTATQNKENGKTQKHADATRIGVWRHRHSHETHALLQTPPHVTGKRQTLPSDRHARNSQLTARWRRLGLGQRAAGPRRNSRSNKMRARVKIFTGYHARPEVKGHGRDGIGRWYRAHETTQSEYLAARAAAGLALSFMGEEARASAQIER